MTSSLIFKRARAMCTKFRMRMVGRDLSMHSEDAADTEELKDARKSLDVNEEYLNAFRTRSFIDLYGKARFLANAHQVPSPLHSHERPSHVVDELGEQSLSSLLESTVLSKQPKLKLLMLRYFDVIAAASDMCIDLLTWIQQIKAMDHTMRREYDEISDEECWRNGMNTITSELIINPSLVQTSPVGSPNEHDFQSIQDEYCSILNCLKPWRKKVARKIRLIRLLHKAAQTLTLLLMGPAILSFPLKRFRRKMYNTFGSARTRVLEKVGEQLDIAAKGTYILDRDFDMITRLVSRLQDEIEHNNTTVHLCLMRGEGETSEPLTNELKKRNIAFQKRAEELEEHLYLCLATIKWAKDVVVKEMIM